MDHLRLISFGWNSHGQLTVQFSVKINLVSTIIYISDFHLSLTFSFSDIGFNWIQVEEKTKYLFVVEINHNLYHFQFVFLSSTTRLHSLMQNVSEIIEHNDWNEF